MDELKKLGCERVVKEITPGGKVERRGQENVICFLRKGDNLVV